MIKLFFYIFVILFMIVNYAICTVSVEAADISLPKTEACTFYLEGDISIGDANKFSLLFNPFIYENPILCLNSDGGNFSEAVKIIDTFSPNVRTVIQQNHRCLSACALIFLAGRQYRWIGSTVPDRWMHVTSKLGFHAPYLPLDSSSPRAFTAGVKAIAALISRSAGRDGSAMFPQDLLAEALSVSDPNDFFEIQWVFQLIRWQIRVLGMSNSAYGINGCVISRACLNFIQQTDWSIEYNSLKNIEKSPNMDNKFPFNHYLSLSSRALLLEGPVKPLSWFFDPIRFQNGMNSGKLKFKMGTDKSGNFICKYEISFNGDNLLIDLSAKNGIGRYTNDYLKRFPKYDTAPLSRFNSGENSAYLLDPRIKIKDIPLNGISSNESVCKLGLDREYPTNIE